MDKIGQKFFANFSLNIFCYKIGGWQSRESELIKGGLIFKSPNKDLIDEVWPADERPTKPSSQIYIHDIKYAGRTWAEKVQLVQARIKNEGADLYVVTALDEIACLYHFILFIKALFQ